MHSAKANSKVGDIFFGPFLYCRGRCTKDDPSLQELEDETVAPGSFNSIRGTMTRLLYVSFAVKSRYRRNTAENLVGCVTSVISGHSGS